MIRDNFPIKRVEWIGASRQRLRNFPDEAKNIAGNQIWLLQIGRQPDDSKPVKTIGPGVFEIRIHRPHEYRIMYVAKFPEAIYILHCFAKKTQEISLKELNVVRRAYAEVQKI